MKTNVWDLPLHVSHIHPDYTFVDGSLVLPHYHIDCENVKFLCPGDVIDGHIWERDCSDLIGGKPLLCNEHGRECQMKYLHFTRIWSRKCDNIWGQGRCDNDRFWYHEKCPKLVGLLVI